MNQPSLQEVQRWLKSKILPESQTSSKIQAVELNPQGDAPGVERLAVYADGYMARVEEALAEVYETLRHVVGRTAFQKLAASYARRYPSHDYNLSLVGRHLPDHIAGLPAVGELPFLPDLARLEWLVAQAFHAFDQSPMETAQMAGWSLEDWERAQVIFQPSVGSISSAWPILDIWQAREKPVEEIRIELVNRPQQVIVFRHGHQVCCALLKEHQQALLGQLLRGQPLGSACEAVAEAAGETSLPLTDWFTQWVRDGLIIRCERMGEIV